MRKEYLASAFILSLMIFSGCQNEQNNNQMTESVQTAATYEVSETSFEEVSSSVTEISETEKTEVVSSLATEVSETETTEIVSASENAESENHHDIPAGTPEYYSLQLYDKNIRGTGPVFDEAKIQYRLECAELDSISEISNYNIQISVYNYITEQFLASTGKNISIYDSEKYNDLGYEIYYINGYCFVNVRTKTSSSQAIYDLAEGLRIDFSDLFYKDIDFVSIINDEFYKEYESADLKRPFQGIEENLIFTLNRSSIGIDAGKPNAYKSGLGISFDVYDMYDKCCVFRKRNTEKLINCNTKISFYDSEMFVKIIKHSDDENLLYYPAESRKYTEDQLEKVRETARNIFCSRKEELTEYKGVASTLYYHDFAEYFEVIISDSQVMLTPEQHWIDANTGEILPSAELARRCLGSKYDEIMSDNPDFYERVSQDELTRMFSDIRYDKITGEPYYNFCFFSDHIWNEEENKYVHEDWSFNIPIEL